MDYLQESCDKCQYQGLQQQIVAKQGCLAASVGVMKGRYGIAVVEILSGCHADHMFETPLASLVTSTEGRIICNLKLAKCHFMNLF